MRVLSILLVVAFLVSGCGEDDPVSPEYSADPISDLTVEATSPTVVTLIWTAPTVGGYAASGYQIRYIEGDLDQDNWSEATELEAPFPGVPDEEESFWTHGLPPGRDLSFGIRFKLQDWTSALSNVASVTMADGDPEPEGFVHITAGEFSMGSPEDERGRNDNEVLHNVTLTRPFYLASTEVTQADYEALMGENPSDHRGDLFPVEQVSWLDAVFYCNLRSLYEGLVPSYAVNDGQVTWNQDANGYRLPTEAEWEYACRAGTTTSCVAGNIRELGCERDAYLGAVATYCGNDEDDGEVGHDTVGGRLANGWGLHDMHGNVLEWCWDRYRSELNGSMTDPTGPVVGTNRVIRGGAWTSPSQSCRSASRSYRAPDQVSPGVGFRLARWVASS